MPKIEEKEALKKYFKGLQVGNQLDLEERRRATVSERIRQASLWFGIMTPEGLILRAKKEEEVRRIWARLGGGRGRKPRKNDSGR